MYKPSVVESHPGGDGLKEDSPRRRHSHGGTGYQWGYCERR
jgi:hypothetical protein